MGFLSFLTNSSKSDTTHLVRLAAGSVTVDKLGRVLVSTLPSSFPEALVNEIASQVQATFREALSAQLDVRELVIHFPTLKITARELRGGALIFFVPINQASATGRFTRV